MKPPIFTAQLVRLFLLMQLKNYAVAYNTWMVYVYRITAICMSSADHDVNDVMKRMESCVQVQQLHLKCVNHESKLSTLNWASQEQHTMPCGWLGLQAQFQTRRHGMSWEIQVAVSFNLNLTFHHFNFPMPKGKCQMFQSSEVLLVVQGSHCNLPRMTMHFAESDHTSPSNGITPQPAIMYMAVKERKLWGNFLMSYQVCENMKEKLQNHIIRDGAFVPLDSKKQLHISNLLPSSNRDQLFGYSYHLLGDRLRQLGARLQFQTFNFSGRNVEVRAYEGPTSCSVHQHPDDKKLLSGDWINFVTFQGVLQIQCWISDCRFIRIIYKWEMVTRMTPGFWPNFDTSKSIEISFPSKKWCLPYNNLVYCSCSLYNFAELNLRIDFVEVTFSGPDYPGLRDDACLLSGLTVTDNARVRAIVNQDARFNVYGDKERELVADNIYPALTTCYHVAVQGYGNATEGLPLDSFVSLTPGVFILIYAYGGYIDLERSRVSLTVSQTSCVGLHFSCPIVLFDAVLMENTMIYSIDETDIAETRARFCPVPGKMMLYYINPYLKRDGYPTDFLIRYLWCTSYSEMERISITTGYVLSHLSSSYDDKKECLTLETNPYMNANHETCSLVQFDLLNTAHTVAAEVRRFDSLYCSMYQNPLEAFALHNEANSSASHSLWHAIPLPAQTYKITGTFVMMTISHLSACISYEMSVSTNCTPFAAHHRSAQPTRSLFDHFHKNTFVYVKCYEYLIPIQMGNIYHTYISPPDVIKYLLVATSKNYAIDNPYTVSRLSVSLGRLMPSLTFSLQSSYCPSMCRMFYITVAFEDTNNYIQWKLDFQHSDSYHISLYRAPLYKWMVWITMLADYLECKTVLCEVSLKISLIRKRCNETTLCTWYSIKRHLPPVQPGDAVASVVSESHIFAQYTLFWTKKKYTWKTAEGFCMDRGMQIASISSEDEFMIVTDMLYGKGYLSMADMSAEHWILTPCRLTVTICIAYVGLKLEVRIQFLKLRISNRTVMMNCGKKCL